MCNLFVSILANLYDGAFLQFVIGLIGASSLSIFTRSLIAGAMGFRFTYFHLSLLSLTC